MNIDFEKQIKIINLFEQGKSINNISKETKTSPFSVLKLQKELKLTNI